METTNTYTLNATTEFLNSQIAQKDERIARLDEHIQTVTQRSYAESAERTRMRNEMQEWTLEQLDESSITESQAEEIASICGFELTKEVEAEVSVTYYITVQVPAGESAEDVINDIDFDAISYDSDKITHVSSSVENIDI
jgi:hypothetical protein